MVKEKTITLASASAWDEYVQAHPRATLYHLSGWQNIIKKSYGHKTYYFMAIRDQHGSQPTVHRLHQTIISPIAQEKNYRSSHKKNEQGSVQVAGILPLIHLKHFIFSNSLVSIPFFDLGGVLSDDEETEKLLLLEAMKLAGKLKANIELRHTQPLSWIGNNLQVTAACQKGIHKSYGLLSKNWVFQTRSHKVRMLRELPESSEALMKSFKSKLRSQIKKPLKEGLTSMVGGIELLEDFYNVFTINMRDLGSPVHSKSLIKNSLEEFKENAKIVLVYKDDKPLACSVIISFRDTLENPWASALRKYSRLSPNMLMYWTMLEYACDNGYTYFDFGRSSPDEGTYKFKKQWGAEPTPLHWQYVYLKGAHVDLETSEKSKFNNVIHYWQKLPVSVTKFLGPKIRKHIGL